ncbi:Metallo-dependent phosphatase-like protein [Sporodiniella umbellata]|nr:Metallo-dependent phosphatase-like protein [Sporodiniella umbellata]
MSTLSIQPIRMVSEVSLVFCFLTFFFKGWLEGHLLESAYNGDLGDFYSFCIQMKKKAKETKKDLFVVDTGDTHDGNGLSDATELKGEISQPLITNIPYDLLTIGNHELYENDITIDTVKNFIPHWKDRYLAANVYLKDANSNRTIQIGNKYTYFQGEFGTRVLAYGFLFNFKGNGDRSVVMQVEEEIAKPWFKQSLRTHEADIVVLIGHVGIRFDEFYHIIAAIRSEYPSIPIAVLGGHTHIRDFVQYDGRAAGIESGRYMETIGFLSVSGISNPQGNLTFNRRYLDQNRMSYIHHSVKGDEKRFDTEQGKAISKKIEALRRTHHLSDRIGCAPQDYYLTSVPVTDKSSIYHLLTHQVLPKTIQDKSRKNLALFLYNTGGIRYDIYQGAFSKSTPYQLSFYKDVFHRIDSVPLTIARQILPALNKKKQLNKRSVLPGTPSRPVPKHEKLTRGYVTEDDHGTDGDDTPHRAIPYVEPPMCVGSDLPEKDTHPWVDIYYLGYLEKRLKTVLTDLTGQTWKENTTISTLTTNTVWSTFVETHWKSCV